MPSNTEGEEVTVAETSDEPAKNFSMRSTVTFVICGVLAVVAFGFGGYLVGNGSGEDLDTARAAGSSAGMNLGSSKGMKTGLRKGVAAGKKTGFAKAYLPAYRKAYFKEWEGAGLEPPKEIRVKVPKS
ncbi:MAG: hypothetical protein JJE13_01220 [Thermoleophilia bacterium]|nr:hypothetical protein [Thermoleophilia bacterium]